MKSDLNVLKRFYANRDEEAFEGDNNTLHVVPSPRRIHSLKIECDCNPALHEAACGLPAFYIHNDRELTPREARKVKPTLPDYHIEGTKQYPVPFGHYVLLKLSEFKNESEAGIILGTNTQKDREQAGMEVGEVVAFGPTAYKGFAGFEGADEWGISIGDTVEFKKYEGKQCFIPGYERFHFIPDSLLVGGNRSVDDE